MCGIAGFVHPDRNHPADPRSLKAMTDAVRFRGPDAEGFYLGPGVSLGHRRLGVIDLQGGRQPMEDERKKAVLVYNGEIYNFIELRKELEGEGAVFKTRCDTEVLLQGYLRWGFGVFPKLVGMFAFALWDAEKESLILGRDRLGVKPLYWSATPDGGLLFGSELGAILAHPQASLTLSFPAVARYLGLSYVNGEESICENVSRLSPASLLIWKRGGGTRIERYWNLLETWEGRRRDVRPSSEILVEFGERMRLAVKQRLVSDVPLGAFLSGGLDSSLIAFLMKEELPSLSTFSIGFLEPTYNELPYARAVAQVLGCDHHEEQLDGNNPDLLLEVASRLDEPLGDTSILPTYLLCRVARQRVTVALSGDGGDELLAGYVTHGADRLHRASRVLPSFLREWIHRSLALIPDDHRKVSFLFKAKKFFSGFGLDECDAHAWWRMLADGSRLGTLLGNDPRLSAVSLFDPFRQSYQEARSLNRLDRALYVDYRTWLQDDILTKVDRASMAHGLEVRSPFLDHRLVEFCAGLPPNLKLGRMNGKVLLRRFAAGRVPKTTLRRGKAGFNSPVSQWMRGSWAPLAEELFSRSAISDLGFVDPAAVEKLWEEHRRGASNHGYLLFSILMLSAWYQNAKPAVARARKSA